MGEYGGEPGTGDGEFGGEAGDSGAEYGDAGDRFPSLQALAGLDRRPLAEHAEVYLQLHAQLQAALAEVDGR